MHEAVFKTPNLPRSAGFSRGKRETRAELGARSRVPGYAERNKLVACLSRRPLGQGKGTPSERTVCLFHNGITLKTAMHYSLGRVFSGTAARFLGARGTQVSMQASLLTVSKNNESTNTK